MFGIVALGIGILFSNLSNNALAQIFEDQFIVCNFESICAVIDIDDYMNKEKSDHLWSQFNNDIDTFTMGDLRN